MCVCVRACLENYLWELVFFIRQVGLEDWSQVGSLGGKHPYTMFIIYMFIVHLSIT